MKTYIKVSLGLTFYFTLLSTVTAQIDYKSEEWFQELRQNITNKDSLDYFFKWYRAGDSILTTNRLNRYVITDEGFYLDTVLYSQKYLTNSYSESGLKQEEEKVESLINNRKSLYKSIGYYYKALDYVSDEFEKDIQQHIGRIYSFLGYVKGYIGDFSGVFDYERAFDLTGNMNYATPILEYLIERNPNEAKYIIEDIRLNSMDNIVGNKIAINNVLNYYKLRVLREKINLDYGFQYEIKEYFEYLKDVKSFYIRNIKKKEDMGDSDGYLYEYYVRPVIIMKEFLANDQVPGMDKEEWVALKCQLKCLTKELINEAIREFEDGREYDIESTKSNFLNWASNFDGIDFEGKIENKVKKYLDLNTSNCYCW